MGIAEILELVAVGSKMIKLASDTYSEIKHTLSETDRKKMEEALAKAQAETQAIRAKVDSALSKV